MRALRGLAAGLFAVAAVIGLGTVVLVVTHHPPASTMERFFLLAGIGVTVAALGVVIAWHAARSPVGALLSWAGVVLTFLAARDVYYAVWLHDRGALPLDTRVVAVLDESGWWLLVAVTLLLLYFPDGRLVGPRWRFMPPLILVLGVVQQVYGAFGDEPFLSPMSHVPRPWGRAPTVVGLLGFVGLIALLVAGLAAAASQVLRFRRVAGIQRTQIKWLSFTGIALVAYPLVCLSELLITGRTGPVAAVFGVVALVALPTTLAVAMLRHDLYDVDRALADAISYAVVIVALVAAYAVGSLAIGLVVGRDSPAAAAGATAFCALLFAPIRTQLRAWIDDRLFPPRRAALQAIDDLQRRVHAEGAQPEELESVLRGHLHDPELRVGMLVPHASGFIDIAGRPVTGSGLVPISLGGSQIGVLTAAESTDPGVLRVIATGAASLVEVSRLRAELAGALREVAASRARLVHVGDAERRRLERDLHDGAQQRLVSLGMAMRLAQRHLGEAGMDINALLDHGVAQLATAIAELRQIARGLRPASLDDGLHSALAALTASMPISVRLDVHDDMIPDNAATTAYYVAAEAITNAAKYAKASRIDVQVSATPDAVRVRISDDGCGGATARPGSGLSGLMDRVSAVGGLLRVDSPDGVGTTLEAVLPCAS